MPSGGEMGGSPTGSVENTGGKLASAFLPSGGSADSFTLAIAHTEGGTTRVIDAQFKLIEASFALHDRIVHLDRALERPEAVVEDVGANPVGDQVSKLSAAFGRVTPQVASR